MIVGVKDLIEKELGFIFGENLFLNHYPDSPDTIVSVIGNRGFPPSLYVPTRERIVEIKIRAKTFLEGMDIGERILNLFHDKENYMLGENIVLHSYAFTDVSFLYTDNQDRNEFSFELAILIQK